MVYLSATNKLNSLTVKPPRLYAIKRGRLNASLTREPQGLRLKYL